MQCKIEVTDAPAHEESVSQVWCPPSAWFPRRPVGPGQCYNKEKQGGQSKQQHQNTATEKKRQSTMAELPRENQSGKQPNATQHTTKAIELYSLVHADQGSNQSRARRHRPVEAQPVRDT